MDTEYLKKLMRSVKDGGISVDDAVNELKNLPYEDLGFANVDHHRNMRNGFAEVIFCQGKTPDQVRQIAARLAAREQAVLGTRASSEVYEAVTADFPDAEYNAAARTIVVNKHLVAKQAEGTIAVITAGTSDIPVAEEAAITAETMGNNVERIFDVGVAGLHRLLARMDKLKAANVLIVAAGMEGALPSVIGGLVDKPVIAVPTSIGYGASFNGLAALLSMLNTCASGVGVVNIDNGFGAGYLASTINRLGNGQSKGI